MRRIPMRLGPMALLLSVISVCLAILAILTVSTAQADQRLANTYSETVSSRYERESLGQEFLAEADAQVQSGGHLSDLPDTVTVDGVTTKTVITGTQSLTISLRETDSSYEIIGWQTETAWTEDANLNLFTK